MGQFEPTVKILPFFVDVFFQFFFGILMACLTLNKYQMSTYDDGIKGP